MATVNPSRICASFARLGLTPSTRAPLRPQSHAVGRILRSATTPATTHTGRRAFSATTAARNWLIPRSGETKKSRKGRPRVPTGGSVRGTTVVWGDYGLRLKDHHRRISAAQLKIGEDTIKRRLRGMKFRLFSRVSANIGVYTSGNETRMGKGKGTFDHWTSRVAVSKIIFELKGDVHEQVVRDAFRLAGNKMPGKYHLSEVSIRSRANPSRRIVRVRQEGRSSGHGNYKTGQWCH
jgi:ribosomal protein L16